MSDPPCINIIMATDRRGLAPNATVLNSLRAHHRGALHVRIFVRDLPPMDFRVGKMRVEFIVTPEEIRLDGRGPEHIPSGPAFDRMAAIEYCQDWDRALVLDYDQLIVGDFTALFRMDMGDALAAGRIWNLNLADACREWFGYRLPYRWRHCSEYEFLMFGPLLNLVEIRKQDLFTRLKEFQRVANTVEQVAFHIACENQVIGIADKYNLVPEWDGLTDDAVVYHFTGPRKPWLDQHVLGANLWQKFETTWDDLTQGKYTSSMADSLLGQIGAGPRLLQLGCGSHRLDGWMNSDVLPWQCDSGVPAMPMEKALPFPDSSLDAIYTEHAIQYLTREQAEAFIAECYRVLRPGGILRIVTPDREVFSNPDSFLTETGVKYKQWVSQRFLSHIADPTDQDLLEMMKTYWGHKYLFSPAKLHETLANSGFDSKAIFDQSLESSSLKSMVSLANTARLPEGFLAFESMVVEAEK